VASLPSSRAPPLTKSVRNCGSSALKGVREHEAQQARDGLESRSILESVEPASSLRPDRSDGLGVRVAPRGSRAAQTINAIITDPGGTNQAAVDSGGNHHVAGEAISTRYAPSRTGSRPSWSSLTRISVALGPSVPTYRGHWNARHFGSRRSKSPIGTSRKSSS
jgi:hypothetical protein